MINWYEKILISLIMVLGTGSFFRYLTKNVS